MKKIKFEYWLVILLSILIIGMFFVIRDKSRRLDDKDNFIEAMNDSLKVIRNRDSSTTATIKSVVFSNFKQFQKIKSQDSLIVRLQKLNKKTQSGIAFNEETKISDKAPTKIIEKDTVYQDNLVYIYPEYRHIYNNKWYNAESITNKDTGFLSIKIRNEYDVSVELGARGYVAVVTSHNPYTQTKEVRSVIIPKDSPKKFGIGIQGGYGFSTDFKPKPYVGVGISYSILRW